MTGRDAAITVKGMLYGISCIQTLPPHRQERSDLDDMIAMVNAMVPSAEMRRVLARRVAAHTGNLPDLGDGEGDPQSEVAVSFGKAADPEVLAWMRLHGERRGDLLVAVAPAVIPAGAPPRIREMMAMTRTNGFVAMSVED